MARSLVPDVEVSKGTWLTKVCDRTDLIVLIARESTL